MSQINNKKKVNHKRKLLERNNTSIKYNNIENNEHKNQKYLSKMTSFYLNNEIEDNFSKNNDEIQNKSIVDNKFSLDLLFKKEPDDIKEFTCRPLFEIKNNCNPRGNVWVIIPKNIAPNQLKQETGNCYMVCALETMSHVPFLLTHIFEGNSSSNQDKFKLTFKGKEIHVILNNFPVENEELKYMKPLENEAYAIIFEKVWASKRGGYNKINGGKSCEVFNYVLGTSSNYLHNDNMKVSDLDAKTYREYQRKSNVSDKDIKDIEDYNKTIKKVKKSDIKMIKTLNKKKYENQKIESEKAFDEIRKAEKEKGAIITVSINIEDGGHCFSVLGTYSKKNDKTGKMQDFVILKNPWRFGDDLKEKFNMPKIEEQINGFDEIIEINRNHYKTGIFYMPKEYFEGWFRSICICTPNYKENFPKVYDTLNLYQDIYEYYNIDSSNSFYESFHGNEFIRTNILSKENLNALLKIVHLVKSDFNFVYKDEKLSTIWLDKNKGLSSSIDDKNEGFSSIDDKNEGFSSIDDKNEGLGSSTEYCFIMKNNTFIVELKEKKDIQESDSNNAQLFYIGITIYKNKWFVIYPSQKPSLEKAKTQNLLLNPLKNDFNYMPLLDNEINGFLKDNSLNSLINQLKNDLSCIKKSQNEINEFLIENPKNLIKSEIIKDSILIQKDKNEINDSFTCNPKNSI